MVRTARPKDAEAVANVTAAAFGMPLGGERWLRSYSLVESNPDQFLVIEQDGRLQGSLRITPEWMQVGSCRLLKGDVGDVSVRPDAQGRGLGTRLMRAAVEHLRSKGFHFSRLGGLPALLEALLPELQSRWDRSKLAWQGTLALAVDEERAVIQLADDQVSVGLEPDPVAGVAQVVEMPTFAFMALLLGLRSWAEVEALARHHLTPTAAQALGALFPPQPTATGLWG